MACTKSHIVWLNLLILAFALHLFVEATEEVLKKETLKPKKAIIEKKADPKSGNKSKSLLVSPLINVNQNDSFDTTPLYEEDDLWNNTNVWKLNVENNTQYNNNTMLVDDKLDDQRYFITRTITDPKKAMDLWVDLDSLPRHQTFTHEVLSDSHRRAASISLPFRFPFYGQNVTRATIATGGFLYMGEHVHSWLAATQYIAPLMANFDTRNSTDSAVLYGHNSSLFVIEWKNVRLQEQPKSLFTFQCILYVNGDIAFVYKDVPISVDAIPDSGHPVKIGVSDAYFINRAHVYVRRKTIYEYHKLDMINTTSKDISNKTAIFLQAKPTCTTLKTCDACVTQKIGFDCVWCAAVARCSDGYDRSRQEWISKHCDQQNINAENECPAVTPPSILVSTTEHSTFTSASSAQSTTVPTVVLSTESADKNFDLHDKNLTQLEYNTHERRISNNIPSNKKAGGSGVALSLIFLLSIVAGIGLWVFYAYRNPTSSSGQLLIRWRPSAWRWNSAETRYTAASIHM